MSLSIYSLSLESNLQWHGSQCFLLYLVNVEELTLASDIYDNRYLQFLDPLSLGTCSLRPTLNKIDQLIVVKNNLQLANCV